MSKQERNRGYNDPYEPSTSSGRSKPYEKKRSEPVSKT